MELALIVSLVASLYALPMPESVSEAAYYDDAVEYTYYEESYDSGDYVSADESTDLRTMGVIEDGDVAYTWYSERVLPGGGLTELNENGRYTDDDGFVRDGDGYIAVASSDYDQGEIIDTPWGEAKVYDSGCDSGVVDVYTGW